MRITKYDFDQFWQARGRELVLNNPTRWYENMMERLDTIRDTEQLDLYVCGLRTGKEATRRLVVEFYQYLARKGRKPESSLYEQRFYDNPIERQLEIAKFLHEPRTDEEILEKFGIDQRTKNADLKALREGICVMGATVKISSAKIKRKTYYRTTCHPVFLPLNLTEVYAMTVYLDRIMGRGDPNAAILRNISRRIKGQLSDYARKRLFPEENAAGMENRYVDDEQMARQREGILMYLMKSMQPCSFYWKGQKYTGRLVWVKQEGMYQLELTDGTYLDAPVNEVDFVIDSLTYK